MAEGRYPGPGAGEPLRWVPMQLGTKGTIYVAVGLLAVGFLAVFLGWNGAAEKDFVAGQLPYVISGGIAGLGIIATGLALAVVDARRRDTAMLAAKLDRLLEHMGAEVEAPEEEPLEVSGNFRRSHAKAKRAS